MRIIMIRALKWILGIVVVGALSFWGFGIYVFESNGTDVAFQSSDGNWADNEVLFKGREFESIATLFELYKIKCNAPTATLQRVTEKPNIFTISRWFDDYGAKKWRVPLSARNTSLNGASYYPNASMEHCYNTGSTKDEFELAKERANEYISTL